MAAPLQALSQYYATDTMAGGAQSSSSTAARITTQQDSATASATFDKGLAALEAVILGDGLVRVPDTSKPGGKRLSKLLESAERDLRTCKNACDVLATECLDKANANANASSGSLGSTSCRVDRGICSAQCTLTLIDVIGKNFPRDPTVNITNALDQQKLMARNALLLRDFADAQALAEIGSAALQRAALEEGLRMSLENYQAYGVPSGETTVSGGSRALETCSMKRWAEAKTCMLENNTPETSFWELLPHAYVCETVAAVALLGCGADTIVRYIPSLP